MSITDITSVQGYSAIQYEELVETAAAKGVSNTEVDAGLLEALNSGKTFTEAVDAVSSDLPLLDLPPTRSASDYYECSSVASPGAAVLAIMIDGTAEERRDNAELRIAETETIVATMEEQADEMRSKAVIDLVTGVVSGAVSIGMGLGTAAYAGASAKRSSAEYSKYTEGLPGDAGGTQTAESITAKGNYDIMVGRQQANTSALGQIGSGLTSITESIGGYASALSEAKIKEMDADIAQMQAFRDILESLDEALSQQISKAISTMEAVQSDMNQTRTRILG